MPPTSFLFLVRVDEKFRFWKIAVSLRGEKERLAWFGDRHQRRVTDRFKRQTPEVEAPG